MIELFGGDLVLSSNCARHFAIDMQSLVTPSVACGLAAWELTVNEDSGLTSGRLNWGQQFNKIPRQSVCALKVRKH